MSKAFSIASGGITVLRSVSSLIGEKPRLINVGVSNSEQYSVVASSVLKSKS